MIRAMLLVGLAVGGAAAAAAQTGAPAVEAPGAQLRWLDKMSGAAGDIELSRGQVAQAGRLTILLDACRYPEGGQPTEAFAHLVIRDALREAPVFQGWMLSAAPALSAMDHHRYDVWVLRCLTE